MPDCLVNIRVYESKVFLFSDRCKWVMNQCLYAKGRLVAAEQMFHSGLQELSPALKLHCQPGLRTEAEYNHVTSSKDNRDTLAQQ